MDIRPLDEALSASPQIAPEDLPAIAAQGFRSVISNRPDGEEPGQPTAEALRQAAEAAGLAFAHVPVVGGAISDQDVADFREDLDRLEHEMPASDSQLPLIDVTRFSRGSRSSTCNCSLGMPLAMSICPARSAARRETWSLKSMISSSSAYGLPAL